MLKIISVGGTRPNFIKIAPLVNEFNNHKKIKHILVHTGQHYDETMSKIFFLDLDIPKPDINLGVGSASDTTQTARIMIELEKVIIRENPNLVVVVGDVNSTLAAALTARKCKIDVAHVESGLRSFDLQMPEETNRILTDHVSSFLFTTEESANRNLIKEGIDENKIFFVGNVMIDTLLKHREKAKDSDVLQKLKLKKKGYAVVTLHRPSNVDNINPLENIISIIEKIQEKIKIVFPVHPRTLKNLRKHGFENKLKNLGNLILTEPQGYLDFLCLLSNSKFIITDSGGIQEEATILQIPCITLRNNTERPVTVEQGTNLLVSTNKDKIIFASMEILKGVKIKSGIPYLWDGSAAKRIVKILISRLEQ